MTSVLVVLRERPEQVGHLAQLVLLVTEVARQPQLQVRAHSVLVRLTDLMLVVPGELQLVGISILLALVAILARVIRLKVLLAAAVGLHPVEVEVEAEGLQGVA